MYYCLKCREYHDDSTALQVLKTGFRTDPIIKQVPLGICDKEIPINTKTLHSSCTKG